LLISKLRFAHVRRSAASLQPRAASLQNSAASLLKLAARGSGRSWSVGENGINVFVLVLCTFRLIRPRSHRSALYSCAPLLPRQSHLKFSEASELPQWSRSDINQLVRSYGNQIALPAAT